MWILINIDDCCTLIKSSNLTWTLMLPSFCRHSLNFLLNVLWLGNSLNLGLVLIHLHLIKRHIIWMLCCAVTSCCCGILCLTILCLSSYFINIRYMLIHSVCNVEIHRINLWGFTNLLNFSHMIISLISWSMSGISCFLICNHCCLSLILISISKEILIGFSIPKWITCRLICHHFKWISYTCKFSFFILVSHLLG